MSISVSRRKLPVQSNNEEEEEKEENNYKVSFVLQSLVSLHVQIPKLYHRQVMDIIVDDMPSWSCSDLDSILKW